MAEVQDEEQWLYGDDKESNVNGQESTSNKVNSTETEKELEEEENSPAEKEDPPAPEEPESNEANEENERSEETTNDNEEAQEPEQNGEKAKDDAEDEDSSSDDEPTVTIGKIVKQPDILRPPPPTHRAAPTSGLKDEDFNSLGKVNGVPVADYSVMELEEKPWRKPGADLSDYFNYGFTEDTWIKYCERQKAMRTNESGIGLAGLGINVGKGALGSSNIPVSIVNENSKYGGLRKPAGVPIMKNMSDDSNNHQSTNVNAIQVMTADRRTYSNKFMSGGGPGYDEMDFGGNQYGEYFNTPPPANFFAPPMPPPASPWGGGIPNVPPPGWAPDGMVGPPMPMHRGPPSGPPGPGYFDDDFMGMNMFNRSTKEDRETVKEDRDTERVREPRESRERETSRRHSSRRKSRSRSKSRHKRRSTRSRSRGSRSPSHRHKKKKSKRERETDSNFIDFL